MITPYPPPLGPRVELLRVRRVDPTINVIPSELPPQAPDPADQPPLPIRSRMDRAEFSAEALRLLEADLLTTSGTKP
jgi:hypothetical protein